MSCTTFSNPDGTRGFVCRRGTGFRPQCPFPALPPEPPPAPPAPDAMHPWRIGGALDHPRYGRGQVTGFDGKRLAVHFPSAHGFKTFDVAALRAALHLPPTIYG